MVLLVIAPAIVLSITLMIRADTVVMKDGSQTTGKIVEESADSVTVETVPGMQMELIRSEIREVRKETAKKTTPTKSAAPPAPTKTDGEVVNTGPPRPSFIIPAWQLEPQV